MRSTCHIAYAMIFLLAGALTAQTEPKSAFTHIDDFVLKQQALGKDWKQLGVLIPQGKVLWSPGGKPNVFRCFGEMRLAGHRVLDVTAVTDGNLVSHFWVGLEPLDQAGRSSLAAAISESLGQPRMLQPGEASEPKVERTCWLSKDMSSAVSLEVLTFADDANGGIPSRMNLHVYKIGDAEAFFFDPALFMLNQGEIEERMTLVAGAGAYGWGGLVSGLAVPVKFFGMDAQFRANFTLGRPMAVQVYFQDETQMPALNGRITAASTSSPFSDAMKELITQRTRSTPSSTFQGAARNQVDLGTGAVTRSPDASATMRSYNVGPQGAYSSSSRYNPRTATADSSGASISGQTRTYYPRANSGTGQSPQLSGSTLEVERTYAVNYAKMLWSPRGWAGNYLLDRRYLTAFAPGIEIAKSLDPNIGSLMGYQSVERASGAPPENIFKASYLFAADYKSIPISHPLGGKYIPIPSTGFRSDGFASQAARLLQYYGHMVDEYRVQKLAADSGNSMDDRRVAMLMERVGFEVREKRNTEDALAFVRSSIDLGIPLVWRQGSEHRIVIGYDAGPKEIIYSSQSIREPFGMRVPVSKMQISHPESYLASVYPRELKSLR